MKTKIACIGNMNNFLFNLTRHLRDKGFDAELLLLREPEHFKPNNDTFSEEYKTYTRQLNWHEKPFWEINKREITNDLSDFDFFIGCEDAPAFLNIGGIKLNIFVPLGEDLYGYSFNLPTWLRPRFKFSFTYVKELYSSYIWYRRRLRFPNNQKCGIKKCNNIFIAQTPIKFQKVIEKLKIQNKTSIVQCPFIYSKEFHPSLIRSLYKKSKYYNTFKKLREENDFLIISNSRHLWKNPPDEWSNKGTDKLIEGLSVFKKTNPNLKFQFITFNYGTDVFESKKLITKHKLEDHVTWLPLIPKKEMMIGLSMIDVGIGSFVVGWYSYGSIFEYLSMGIPVIHYREMDEKLISDPYPMINANSGQEIFYGLNRLLNEKSFSKQLRKSSLEWSTKHIIDIPVSKFIETIENYT